MGKIVRSNASARMLAWGRERAGLSVSEAAFKLKVRSQQILAWESGGSSPTFLQLQKLATQYGFPPATFYLDAPPTDFNVRKIKDRRTLAKASRGTFSHELRRFLTFAEQRQAWASEYLRSTGARRVRRIPQWPEPANAAELSSKLRTLLRVSRDDLAALNDVRAAYNLWRNRISSLGVLVFQSSGVPIEEMRGVSLPDKYAPVIVVNGADSYAARLFTLVHELTHLCLGERSVSGSGTDFIAYESVSRVERFCDQVAAETLVPKSELADFLAKIPSPPSAETLESAATHFKVSRAVIALRLVAVGAVTQSFLRDHQYVFHRPGNEQPKREVKIPASTRVLSRFGRRFTKLVISAYGDDSIHGGELSSLLRMKMKSLPSLESKLFASRVSAVRPS